MMDKYLAPPVYLPLPPVPPVPLPPVPIFSGWQCPICGAVYSFTVTECNNWHGTPVTKSTNGTGGIVYIPDYSTSDAEKYKK